jgi:hypothetical protein
LAICPSQFSKAGGSVVHACFLVASEKVAR